jgi:hypothetical protein
MLLRRTMIFALLLLLGCGGGEKNSSRSEGAVQSETDRGGAERAGTDTNAPLTLEQLRNAAYPLLGVDPVLEVTLDNGEFVDEEERIRAILGENWIARGDLDGDGRGDVAVVLYFDTGGSGNFREFLALSSVDGEPALLGGAFVGDRQRIEAFGIAEQTLIVQMITHAPDDPMCCPTQRVLDRYALRDGELVRVSREELERIEP